MTLFDRGEPPVHSERPSKTAPDIWSVSRLSAEIRRLIEDGLPLVWIEGEISNFKLHSSGHRYFTLKDESAQIACTMWRTRPQPPIPIQDGMKVRLYGRVTIWEQGGRYQFDVANLLPAGIGDLQIAFEALKQKLTTEGLFEQARKKQLPRFPGAIGIVTSPTGAVIHDLVWGFATRYPPAKLFLIPTAVQGDGAGAQIAAAIQAYNRLNLVDVIIIARGGGSLEDLWAFNEEVVVRAVAGSRIPVVSAVGHEVDVSLCDFAADVRAPTPTGAAAMVVPDRRDLLETIAKRSETLTRNLVRIVSLWRERVGAIRDGYGFRRVIGRVGEERQRLDGLSRRMEIAVSSQLSNRISRLQGLVGRVEALSPGAVLQRGFSVIQKPDGALVRTAHEIERGERLTARFGVGGADMAVERKWDE